MQGFQTHTAVQPISIQPLQTQQKPHVTQARHNAEKHSLFLIGELNYSWTFHFTGLQTDLSNDVWQEWYCHTARCSTDINWISQMLVSKLSHLRFLGNKVSKID